MNSSRCYLLLTLAAGLALGSAAQAQSWPAHWLCLPGRRGQGTTFQVNIGGRALGSPSNLLVSGKGVQAKIIDYNKPITQKEFQELRDKLQKLMMEEKKMRRS